MCFILYLHVDVQGFYLIYTPYPWLHFDLFIPRSRRWGKAEVSVSFRGRKEMENLKAKALQWHCICHIVWGRYGWILKVSVTVTKVCWSYHWSRDFSKIGPIFIPIVLNAMFLTCFIVMYIITLRFSAASTSCHPPFFCVITLFSLWWTRNGLRYFEDGKGLHTEPGFFTMFNGFQW